MSFWSPEPPCIYWVKRQLHMSWNIGIAWCSELLRINDGCTRALLARAKKKVDFSQSLYFHLTRVASLEPKPLLLPFWINPTSSHRPFWFTYPSENWDLLSSALALPYALTCKIFVTCQEAQESSLHTLFSIATEKASFPFFTWFLVVYSSTKTHSPCLSVCLYNLCTRPPIRYLLGG